jgi:hypothetical protein
MVEWREEQPTPGCPWCGLTENVKHAWLCQKPAVFFVRALLKSSLRSWLESVHTANEITFWIIQ